jgi:hypothetical protein
MSDHDDKFKWFEKEVHWETGQPADPVRLREALKEFREEMLALRDCNHPGESVKFNGGNPWVICSECGLKLRDATDDDLSRARSKEPPW